MEPTALQRALDVLEASLDLPDDARRAMLAAAAVADPEVGAELRRLDAGQSGAQRLVATDPGEAMDADLPLPPQIGVFRLIRLLGRGGMGTVYEAERVDGLFQQRVAIKLLAGRRWSEEIQQRFATERQILAKLEQRNIARIYDGGVAEDGHSYIVMEYIDGLSITEHANQHSLTLEARLSLMQQLCGAVQFAHQQLVVHADIKPNNVLVTKDGSVKLLDFGISQLLDQPTDTAARVGSGSRDPLTVAYAAPERAAGGAPSVAADVYSLGIVLRELLQATSTSASLPPGIAAVVHKAIANEPAARYGSVAALSADLSRWMKNIPISAVADSFRYRASLFIKRNRVAVIVGALTLVGLSTATAVSTRSYFVAERARREADSARAAEIARFNESRSLTSYLVNSLSDEMATRPGMADAHRKTLTEARLRLVRMANSKPTDAGLQIELGQDIAALAWSAFRNGRDGPDQLALVRRDVVTIMQRLDALRNVAAGLPRYWETLSELQHIQAEASLLIDGNATAALGHAESAVASAEQALQRRPTDVYARSAVISAITQQGMTLMGAGRFPESVNALERASAGLASLEAARLQSDARTLGIVVGAEFRLCEVTRWKDADAAALSRCTAVEAKLRKLLGEYGNTTILEEVLAYTLFLSATMLPQPLQSEQVLQQLDEARDIYTRILHFGDDDLATSYLLVVQAARAVALANLRRFDEARAVAANLLAQRRSRFAADPSHHGKHRELAIAYRRVGEVEQMAGQREAACAAFAQSGAIWDRIQQDGTMLGFDLAEKSGQVPWIRRRMALCHHAGKGR